MTVAPPQIFKISPQGSTAEFATLDYFSHKGIAIDTAGNIYTAQTISSTITKILADGSVTTNWTVTGTLPLAIKIDTANNVYTANEIDRTVTKIFPNGTAAQYGGKTGPAPVDIAIDNDNNVYTLNQNDRYRFGLPEYAYNTVTKISVSNCTTIRDETNSSDDGCNDSNVNLELGLGLGLGLGLPLFVVLIYIGVVTHYRQGTSDSARESFL